MASGVSTHAARKSLRLIRTRLSDGQATSISRGLYNSFYRVLPPGAWKHSVLSALADDLDLTLLTSDSERTALRVRNAAEEIYGDKWNLVSDALRPEVIDCFNQSIRRLIQGFSSIDYLEIGSAQGLSMSFIGATLQKAKVLGSLISIDPYLEDGFIEEGNYVPINKETKTKANRLYSFLGLPVSIIEKTSSEGLLELLKADRQFNLIYIDGYHSRLVPTLDFGLSYHLLSGGGVIMIDDHVWPDVTGLKALCDRHCEKICESWKVACYVIRKG